MKIPKGTFDNYILKDVNRLYPSLDCLARQESKELDTRVRHLVRFTDRAKVSFQVVDFIANWVSNRARFEERQIDVQICDSQPKKKYFFRDPWEGSSMVVVKEGEQPITDGFNLIICHSDSPCLRLKPRPVKLEWAEDEIFNFLGARFSATLYGGGLVHHWIGQQVNIIGYALDKNGARRAIEIPGVIGDYASHVDDRDDEEVRIAFPKEQSLEVIAGHTNIKGVLAGFGFKSLDDFAEAKLFAVPTNPSLPIDEYTWRLLTGYGLDDRVCVFSATDAIVKAKNPKKTSLVWITDNEEIGDVQPTGASGHFLDSVLDHIADKNHINLSEKIRRKMFHKSSLLIGDVNIAPYGHDSEKMDVTNAPKLGFGVYIACDDNEISSPDFVRKLRNLAKRGEYAEGNICHQLCGDFNNQDKQDLWYRGYFDGKDAQLSRIGQWAWVGVPCASTHSHNEIVCPADEMWTSKLYKRFFEADLSL